VDFKMKGDSFGGCYAESMSPTRDQLSPEKRVLSFMFSFEELLKLKTSIDDAVLWLNRVNRTAAGGKQAAVRFNIRLEDFRFYSMRGKLPAHPAGPRKPPEPEEEE
jgi:hypothetical protein